MDLDSLRVFVQAEKRRLFVAGREALIFIAGKKIKAGEKPAFFGGDGGNRNRVRKPILPTFYEHSLSIKLPRRGRR